MFDFDKSKCLECPYYRKGDGDENDFDEKKCRCHQWECCPQVDEYYQD